MVDENKKMLIREYKSPCPVCGGEFIVRVLEYDMPSEGLSVIVSGKCLVCGYRVSWIIPSSESKPRILKLRVEELRDLNSLVYVSAPSRIVIPELNLELKLTGHDMGFVTTVEGVLERFREKIEFLCRSEESSECRVLEEMISKAICGELEFTLVIEDYSGRSSINSRKAIIEEEFESQSI